MKTLFSLSLFSLFFIITANRLIAQDTPLKNGAENQYQSIGKSIIPDDAISAKSMLGHYQTMKSGDSINTKMIAKVKGVCQEKGCWMTLNLEDGN